MGGKFHTYICLAILLTCTSCIIFIYTSTNQINYNTLTTSNIEPTTKERGINSQPKKKKKDSIQHYIIPKKEEHVTNSVDTLFSKIDNTITDDVDITSENIKTKPSVFLTDPPIYDEVTSEELEQFHSNVKTDIFDHKSTNEDVNKNNVVSNKEQFWTNKPIVLKGKVRKRFPGAIIVGTKKSGTRAILSFIAKHPLVQSAGREMHFFDKDINYGKGLSWYLDEMPESYENQITMEKTPGYFVRPHVPERIHEFNKDMKLIFIFREPVRRAISDYTHDLAKSSTIRSFKEMVTLKRNQDKIKEKDSKVLVGNYYSHLLRWLQYFPISQMHFVDGDKFIQNPAPGIIALQKFLDLPVLITEESFVLNKKKGFYCYVEKKSTSSEIIYCLGNNKGRKHPPVDSAVVQKLTDYYRPLNKLFFNLIGQDYGWPT